MHDFARFWAEGGVWMYPIAVFGLVGAFATLGLGIGALVSPPESRRTLIFATLLLALGLASMATGVLGQQAGLRATEEAIANVNPADREVIRAAGTAEARSPFIFGIACGLLPLCAGLGLLGLGFARSPRAAPR